MKKKTTPFYLGLLVLVVSLLFGCLWYFPTKQQNYNKRSSYQQEQKKDEAPKNNPEVLSKSLLPDEICNKNFDQRESKESIQDEAEHTLKKYYLERNCALVYSGYLDLMGNVWTCLVHGGTWSEIVTISDYGDVRRISTCRFSANNSKDLSTSTTLL